MQTRAIFASPWGRIAAVSNGQAVCALSFTDEAPLATDDKVLLELQHQLKAFASGSLQHFNLPLAAEGTDFQQRVWEHVQTIPFGQTRSYAEVAAALGDPNASRAVGLANGKNPILLLVPCHRVVGANGSLTGYAGGIERKRNLLIHEQQVAGHVLF